MNDELYLERENTKVLSRKINDADEQLHRLEYELNNKETALQIEIERGSAVESNLLAEKDRHNLQQEMLDLISKLENKIYERKEDADKYI